MKRVESTSARSGRVDGQVHASLGKEMDAVRAFNRALLIYRTINEGDRAEYTKAYESGYAAECNTMRARGAL